MCLQDTLWLYIVFLWYYRRTGTDRALLIWCSISLIIHGTFDSSLDENTPLVIGTNFLIYIWQPRTNRLFVSRLQLLGMPTNGAKWLANYRISVNIGSCHVRRDAFPQGLLCVLYCEELFYDLVNVLHLQQLCVLVMFFFYVDMNKLSSACVCASSSLRVRVFKVGIDPVTFPFCHSPPASPSLSFSQAVCVRALGF